MKHEVLDAFECGGGGHCCLAVPGDLPVHPLEQFVESTEYAFGVTGVSSARKRKVKILAFDGVDPTPQNIASGDYPLFRPLYLVTKGPPAGAKKDFLEWILSDEGQAVLARAGTVNLAEGAALKALFEHWPADTSVIRNY